MKKVLVLLMLCMLAYSQSNIEKGGIISKPATGEVISDVQTTITIEKSMFDEFPELTSRSYSVQLTSAGSGVLVSPDGHLIANDELADEKIMRRGVFEKLLPRIINDAGVIEHVQKFGSEPTASQIASFKPYFIEKYGGEEAILQRFENSYLMGNISVEIEKQDYLFNIDGNVHNAEIIEKDKMFILKIEGKNYPSILYSDVEMDAGDSVYFIGYDGRNVDAVPVIISYENGYYVDVESDEGMTFVLDKDGNVLGIAEESYGGYDIFPVNEMEDRMESMVNQTNSLTTKTYAIAMAAYWNGDYEKAEEELGYVLSLYPEHSDARYYLQDSRNHLEGEETKGTLGLDEMVEFLTSTLVVLIIAAIALALVILKILKKI